MKETVYKSIKVSTYKSIAQANDSISLRKVDVKQSIQDGLAKEMKFDHNFIYKLHDITAPRDVFCHNDCVY